MHAPIDYHQVVPQPLGQLHTPLVRNELEISTAYTDETLRHELHCALFELPMLCEWSAQNQVNYHSLSALMAWCFEAGRRYGLIEAMCVIDHSLAETLLNLANATPPQDPRIPVRGAVGDSGTVTWNQTKREPIPIRSGYAATHSADEAAQHNALIAWAERTGYQPDHEAVLSDEEVKELTRRLTATPHREAPPHDIESQPKSYPNGLSEKFNLPAIAEFNIAFVPPEPGQTPISNALTERVDDFIERRAGFGRRETDQPLNYTSAFQKACREAAAASVTDDCCRDL